MISETTNQPSLLSGANVNNVKDPLLFPDPPTPCRRRRTNGTRLSLGPTARQQSQNFSIEKKVGTSTENRRKRRNSSPVVPLDESEALFASTIVNGKIGNGPTPPRDVTNIAITETKRLSTRKDLNSQTVADWSEKSRISNKDEQCKDIATETFGRPPRKGLSSSKYNSSFSKKIHDQSENVQMKETESDEAVVSRKWRRSDKQRASFIPPFDGAIPKGNEHSHLKDREERVSEMLDQSTVNGERSTTFDRAEYSKLRQAVVKYCKIHYSQRPLSDDAMHHSRAIEDLSGGYKLLSNYQQHHLERQREGIVRSQKDLAKDLDKNQRAIYHSMPPMINFLEKEKAKESSRVQQSTNCRVEKRGSTYSYIDLTSGEAMKREEYERRYLLSLKTSSQLEVSPSMNPSENVQSTEDFDSSIIGKQQSSGPSLIESSSNDAEEPGVPSPTRRKRCRYESDDDGSAVDRQHSLPESPRPSMKISSPGCNALDNRSNGVNFITSIPLRSELSSHPQIAMAQKKLWNAMDCALEEYSSTVMRIHEQEHKITHK